MNCLAITLNAAIDATYVVAQFEHGGANRVLRMKRMPGGKGNNVARILAARGHPVVATGFLGGASGTFIEQGLANAGVEPAFVRLASGESRTCHAILEDGTGVVTEILEAGPDIATADAERFLAQLPGVLDQADVAIISGSPPPGASSAFLERLATVIRSGARRMVVDSSGQGLVSLLGGKPDLIKPNASELRALIGRDVPLEEQIALVRDEVIGPRMAPDGQVLVSLGQDGALLVSESGVWRARAPAIAVVNTVGCGDALLAGYVDAWISGQSCRDALRQAVAYGSAAALQEVAGLVDMDDVRRLLPEIDAIGDVLAVRQDMDAHGGGAT